MAAANQPAEQQPAEGYEGTIHLTGARASFEESKVLLERALDEGMTSELVDDIDAFLAPFEADA